MPDQRLSASFRDPSGFLFERGGGLFRQINRCYEADYRLLRESGLYDALVKRGLLIPHREVAEPPADPEPAALVIEPERVPFISYPYEWSFSQLQDAALATLALQQAALDHGMSLKDASAYNIQFHRGRPTLVDTLSFERYQSGQPWVAYRQFCQHFLAPLALMAKTDVRLGQLLRVYIDGVPLDLASRLLPGRTRWSAGLGFHLHLHAKMQARYAGQGEAVARNTRQMSLAGLRGLIGSLESAVRGLRWRPAGTEWADYYQGTNYDEAAFEHKRQLVARFIEQAAPKTVWDLGANTGVFSRLASDRGVPTVAFDIDPAAVEKNYLDCRTRKDQALLPLVMDLTNPSSGLGWANAERTGLLARGPADLALALALVHHLAIGNNVPLGSVASFLRGCGRWLVIEFVPKADSQVKRLLASREDIFEEYDQAGFERRFAPCWRTVAQEKIPGTERTLYLMTAVEA